MLLQHLPNAASFLIAHEPSTASHHDGSSSRSSSRPFPMTATAVVGPFSMARGGGGGGESDQRRPWDFFRFLQQSSRFVTVLPSPSATFGAINGGRPVPPGTLLWTAGGGGDAGTGTTNVFTFSPLDDVVMGGASSSSFDGATGKWRGTVTDANNGGFVGIRSTPYADRIDLSRCKGVEWTLAGTDDDMRLKVVLRDSSEFNGVGWTSSRDTTKGPSGGRLKSFVTFRIPFREQVPCRFAKVMSDAPPFDPSNVKAFQLVYSKFEYDGALNPKFRTGDFEIQMKEIRTY